MKKILSILILFAAMFAVQAQKSILVYNNVDVEDSLVVNFSYEKDVHKWSSFYIEALFTGLAAADTTAAVEIYNVLNGDYTDATNLDTGDALVAADGSGGTGTIMKTVTITNSALNQLRFVVDPAASGTSNAKVTVRIVPTYKAAYSPPN